MIRPPSGKPPTEKQAFERRCYLNGVTEPSAVARLWRERCAARDEARKRRSRREGGLT